MIETELYSSLSDSNLTLHLNQAEEFAQRGDEIDDSLVRPQVEAGNPETIVAIDLETGDFDVDASEITACDRPSSQR